jgi:predicted DNA-binding antitoxin AbrB/MazE fold protein
MVRVVDAVYDGQVLRPTGPLNLEKNAHVRVTVESVEHARDEAQSFLAVAMSLKLDGPVDWSESVEEYLEEGRRDGQFLFVLAPIYFSAWAL